MRVCTMKHIKKNLSWFNENVIMLCDKYRTTQCIPLMVIKKKPTFPALAPAAGWRGGGSGTRGGGKREQPWPSLSLDWLTRCPLKSGPNLPPGPFAWSTFHFTRKIQRQETEFNLFSTSGYLCCATSLGFLIKLAINLINLNTPGIVKYQFQEARIASSIISLWI